MWDFGFGIQGNIRMYLGNFMRMSSLGAYIWATPHWERNFCGIASKASSWYGWEDPPIEHRKRTLSRAFAGMCGPDPQKVLHNLS